jgi:cytoskeleton protein RodZ
MAVEGGSIGARLRAGREKHSLTVLQVAERIHTDPKIVEAIEADNFPALGAPVYARGHIRHYAELVGESATELIALYSDLSKVGQPDLTQIVKASSSADTNRLVAPALVVIAVFAVAGAVWWVSSLSKKKPQLSETHVVGEEEPGSTANVESGPADAGQAQSPSPGPAVGSDSGGGAQRRSVGGGAPSTAGTGAQGGRSGTNGVGSTPQPRPAPSASSTGPARPTSGSSVPARAAPGTSSPTPAPASASASAASRAATPQAQVTLRYLADSWTEVYDATGARLFYDVGSANSVQNVVGTPPLRVVLGNASGVVVEFNGHSMPITKLAHPDGSVQFSINRSGRVIRAKPVADGG